MYPPCSERKSRAAFSDRGHVDTGEHPCGANARRLGHGREKKEREREKERRRTTLSVDAKTLLSSRLRGVDGRALVGAETAGGATVGRLWLSGSIVRRRVHAADRGHRWVRDARESRGER